MLEMPPPNVAYVQFVKSIKHQIVLEKIPNSNSEPITSIIKIPDTPQITTSALSYDQLICTEIDKQKIARLITVMGENGKLVLWAKYQKELRQIGREIDHVHPLKFLSTIFSNPALKNYMKEIYHDYFKWTNFMDGLGNGLTAQAKQGKIAPFLNDFAKEVGAQPESLRGYVESLDWENMILFLMNN